MNRREWMAAVGALAVTRAGSALAQDLAATYQMPPPFTRPDPASDEGGLWAIMDREERQLKRSPFIVRDAELQAYVQGIACKLAANHCPDVRVLLVRTPLFNASMAPNGMMQVWTGLLLRADNEAQLAAVLGHEIGHYLQRHALLRLQDAKTKSAFGQYLGFFGLLGAVGQIAVAASAYAYGRDHEREADSIGARLMHDAGYDVSEAARIWTNLEAETEARNGKKSAASSPLFATHPATPERQETLSRIAASMPGGETGAARYTAMVARHLDEWWQDELKRGQHEETLALLSRRIDDKLMPGRMYYYRGEVYRMRNRDNDQELAFNDYQRATQQTDGPATAYRGMGLIARQRGDRTAAAEALGRYIALAPDGPDVPLIKTYLAELTQ